MDDVATSYRYIVRTEGIRGGNARVENTRIGVHDVVAYHLLGLDVEAIRDAFPDLTRAQIYDAFGRHQNREAISRAISRLSAAGMAKSVSTATGGRPEERWFHRQNHAR